MSSWNRRKRDYTPKVREWLDESTGQWVTMVFRMSSTSTEMRSVVVRKCAGGEVCGTWSDVKIGGGEDERTAAERWKRLEAESGIVLMRYTDPTETIRMSAT